MSDAPYKDLEDSLYTYVTTLFPTWTVKFSFGNGPEPVSPYLNIDVRKIGNVGLEYTSAATYLADDLTSSTTTFQNYEAQVRFEFVGVSDVNTTLAEMASALEFGLRTQRGHEEQRRNRLSLMRHKPVRRLAVRRETDTYMYYQLDVTFGYVIAGTDTQDYIMSLDIHGVYHDAGREPDHIIRTDIQI